MRTGAGTAGIAPARSGERGGGRSASRASGTAPRTRHGHGASLGHPPVHPLLAEGASGGGRPRTRCRGGAPLGGCRARGGLRGPFPQSCLVTAACGPGAPPASVTSAVDFFAFLRATCARALWLACFSGSWRCPDSAPHLCQPHEIFRAEMLLKMSRSSFKPGYPFQSVNFLVDTQIAGASARRQLALALQ